MSLEPGREGSKSSLIIWSNADPPRKEKSPDGGQAIRAKQLNGMGAKASAQNMLAPRSAASRETEGA